MTFVRRPEKVSPEIFQEKMIEIVKIWNLSLSEEAGAFVAMVGIRKTETGAAPHVIINPGVNTLDPLTRSFVYDAIIKVFRELRDEALSMVKSVTDTIQ